MSTSRISSALRARYAEQNAAPIENDFEKIEELGLSVLKADLLQRGRKVRHNPAALADVAVKMAIEGRIRRELRH